VGVNEGEEAEAAGVPDLLEEAVEEAGVGGVGGAGATGEVVEGEGGDDAVVGASSEGAARLGREGADAPADGVVDLSRHREDVRRRAHGRTQDRGMRRGLRQEPTSTLSGALAGGEAGDAPLAVPVGAGVEGEASTQAGA